MSTRALYTFKDEHGTFHVYKHHDGYPSGAIAHIEAAKPHAWALPRFEADEFAAAFVTGNKPDGGSVRLMPSGPWRKVAPGDIEYRYEITTSNGRLVIKGWHVSETDLSGTGKWSETLVTDWAA